MMMKAVRFHEYGDPSVLRYEDADRPIPGPGQVLVQVAATAFNPVDATMRAGHMRQMAPVRLPHITGYDLAGTVVELGDGVTGFKVGDQVVGFLPPTEDGAAAEFALAPVEVLTAAPTSIALADAAALPLAGLTAWQALFEHAGLQGGQRILINGAGGGVGGFAIQLAKRAGATVIATASRRSTDAVRAAGADQIVDYTAVPVAEAVEKPVDVVLNLVQASEEVTALFGLINPGGVLVTTTGPVAGEPGSGVRLVPMYTRSDAGHLAQIVAAVDDGTLHVEVTETVSLLETASVHERSASGQTRGKVLLLPPQ